MTDEVRSCEPSLPIPWTTHGLKRSHVGLPSPPASSEPLSQSNTLVADLSDLSDIEITSSPPPTQLSGLVDSPSRKRKLWQVEEDATIVKTVLLRKLFPQRKDINWEAVCRELERSSKPHNQYQPGRVRSRFFSTMHSIASTYGVSHRDLCTQLAMPFESNASSRVDGHSAQTASHSMLKVASKQTAAMRKLNDLAFNAKLKEARQAHDAHRPDIVARRKASEGLKNMRSSQILSSSPVRTPPSGLNERMAAIPILNNPVPPQLQTTPRQIQIDQLQFSQQPQSQQCAATSQAASSQTFTQISQSAAQLQSELGTHAQSTSKQEWEWSESTRGYTPKAVPTLNQNLWRNPTEIYNSAIAYNVKVSKGKKKEKLFVYENPLMSEQLKERQDSNCNREKKNAQRRHERGTDRVVKKGKKRPGKHSKRADGGGTASNRRPDTNTGGGSKETCEKLRLLKARLELKALGRK